MDLKNLGASILGNVISNAVSGNKGDSNGALKQVTSMLQGVDLSQAASMLAGITQQTGKNTTNLTDFISALQRWQSDKSDGAENRLADLTSKFSMSDLASTVNSIKDHLPTSVSTILNTVLPILGNLKK